MNNLSSVQEKWREHDTDERFQKYRVTKLIFLSIAFFLTIAGYTLIKELKDSLFVGIVGEDYLPVAKQMTILVLIPFIFFYSKLVDTLRRYHLLYFYAIVYGIGGLIVTYLLGHPEIGIANTDTSPFRYFGWLLYFFFEGYSPFVVSVFWAFANSISSPEGARTDYALMISGSKLGGMMSAGFAWILFRLQDSSGNHYSDAFTHQILLGLASVLLLCVPITIHYLMKKVPGFYLHGYEAAYRVEKEKKKKGVSQTGVWAGFKMLIQYPYVMGIFGMVFFYEVLNVVLNYQRIVIARAVTTDLSGLSGMLFGHIFIMHFIGLLISFFGTRALVKKLGERRCLLLIPISTGLLLLFFMINYGFGNLIPIELAVPLVYIPLRSINYGFSYPLRESLYIPTVKEVKFKSKAWIDASGSKFAKGFGSIFNILAQAIGKFGSSAFFSVYSAFFGAIIGVWAIVAYLLGKRYDWAVKNNEVIGFEEEGE